MLKVLIVGAGALGSFLAAGLNNAGMACTLHARGERYARVRDEGMRLQPVGTATAIDVDLCENVVAGDIADHVVFCTKVADLPSALDVALPAIGPQTSLLLLQNGVDAPGIASMRYPESPVLAARVHGLFELEDNVARRVGVEPSLVLGAIAAAGSDAARRMAALLQQADVATRVAHDIEAELWEKLVLTSAFGGVGLACGLGTGGLRQSPEAWQMLEQAIVEVVRLAKARRISMPPDCAARTLAFIEAFPSVATTSMHRDLAAQRPSEYASLTGAVIRMAREMQVPVPVHDKIEALIRAQRLLVRTQFRTEKVARPDAPPR